MKANIEEDAIPPPKECLNRRKIQYAAVFTASLCMMSSGMHYGWSSPALPQLMANDSYLPITSSQGSWIASLCLLGDLAGAPLSAFCADKLGRKMTIILAGIPLLASWIMIAFAKHVEVIYCARFLVGIGDGIAYTVIPMYIGEIAEDGIRGILISTICTMCDLGILLMYLVGPFVTIMTAALISSILPLILILTFWCMPESPYYRLMRGDEQGAENSLQKLRGKKDVGCELKNMKIVVEAQMGEKKGIKEILTTRSNRSAFLIVVGLKTAQQLSGITAFLFYSQIIFESAGGSVTSAVCSILFGLVQFLSCIFSSFVIDKIGRKPLLIASCIGTSIALILQGTYFYLQFQESVHLTQNRWLPLFSMLLFIISYSFGFGVVPYTMPGELFPTNIKARALCMSDMYLASSAFAVAKLYQVISDYFGAHVPFYLFTFCCILSLVFVHFCVPETKGRSLEEIQEWLKGNKDPQKYVSKF